MPSIDDIYEALSAAVERKKYRKIDFFQPYPKQREFIAMGATHRERALLAGNQQGKTECGAAEATYHLTGDYPAAWPGRRWDRPVRAWLIGETSLLTRDVQQKKLCGEPGVAEAYGTGLIPRECLVDKSLARGVTDAFDTIQVRHVSGGISTATFKSYDQGRQKHQGEPVDFVWDDEEPPPDIYTEHLARIAATGGMVYCTFTPLKGMSDVVLKYLNEPSPDRGVVTMGIRDALHIPEAERERIIAGYPAHQREARANGVPMLGSGRVFQTPEEALLWNRPPHIPLEWAKIWGIDFGIDHPFAAVLCAWDRELDIWYILRALRMEGLTKLNHIPAMRAIAPAVPVAWPHDGHDRDKGSGMALAQQYRKPGPGMTGLPMLATHATWLDGSNGVEAGITEMDDRMQTGRFFVAADCDLWFEEYRLFHRDGGRLVKLRDDLLSATRYAMMMKRYARPLPLGGNPHAPTISKRPRRVAAYDLFTGRPLSEG